MSPSGAGRGVSLTPSLVEPDQREKLLADGSSNRVKRDVFKSSVTQEYFSPADSAIYLGFRNRDSIYKLIDRNLLPYFKIAGRIRLKRSDLDEHIAKSRTAAKEAGDD
jgi:excisionase family DNA binding protein